MLAAGNARLPQVESLMGDLRSGYGKPMLFTILRSGEAKAIEVEIASEWSGGTNMPFPVPGRIAEFLRRATVQIRSGGADIQGSGSGLVLTWANHYQCARAAVGTDPVEAWDGTSHKAQVISKDAHADLALLSAEGLDAPPAALSGNEPKPGAAVIAVGNPLGFVGAVSTGFVQAVGAIRGLGWRRWVQADLRLAPGNSGGPMADVLGQIVGINTMLPAEWPWRFPPKRPAFSFRQISANFGRNGPPRDAAFTKAIATSRAADPRTSIGRRR